MYLGIDIGTSSVKTVLFDRDQRLIGQASRAARPSSARTPAGPSRTPRPGGPPSRRPSTRSPRDHRARGPARHRPLRPDARRRLPRPRRPRPPPGDPVERRPRDGRMRRARSRLPRARARSPATSPCPASPPRSSLWLRKHEPEIFAHIDTVLLPKDYIRFRLTGHHVSEMSDASGTLWLDVADRDWSDDLLEATGLTRAHMPRLVEGSAPSGDLLPELAARWGIARHRRRRRRRRRQRRRRLRRRRRHARAPPSSRSAPRACSSSPTPASRRTPQGAVHAFCPRHPRHLAPDGRDPLRLRQPRMALPHRRPQARRPRRRGRRLDGPVRRHLPPLPLRRAHARTTTRAPAAPSSASPSRPACPTSPRR